MRLRNSIIYLSVLGLTLVGVALFKFFADADVAELGLRRLGYTLTLAAFLIILFTFAEQARKIDWRRVVKKKRS